MKLSSLVIGTSIAIHSSTRVKGFSESILISRLGSSSSRPLFNSYRKTSLPSLAVTETENDVASDDTLDYFGVNKLTFRELQKQCKERGLPASGNTATLRSRILESLGLIECDVDGEEEVSLVTQTILNA